MYKEVVALDAVTADTLSEEIGVRGAEKITLLLTRANHGSGASTFYVKGKLPGSTTYVDLNLLIDNVVNSNVQTIARVATKAISGANGSVLVALDLDHFGFESIKVGVTETTDGTHSAIVFVEFED